MRAFDQGLAAPLAARRSDFVRRREQVIDTFLDLVLEGDPGPTPATIAERAGVSRASVFRYFSSLEDLRNEAMGRVLVRFLDLFELGDPSLESGAVRIAHFVDARLRFHETLHRLALLQRRHAVDDEHAAAMIDASRNLLVDQVRAYFRLDLQALGDYGSEDAAITIAVLTSVESWHQSTHSHGRSQDQTRRAWISAITALIADADSAAREEPS